MKKKGTKFKWFGFIVQTKKAFCCHKLLHKKYNIWLTICPLNQYWLIRLGLFKVENEAFYSGLYRLWFDLNAHFLLWYHNRCNWEGFKHTKQKQSGHFMPQARFWWHLTARKAISFTIQSQTLLIAQEVCCSLENTLWYSLSLIFAVHLSLCLFLCGENWFTRVVILIWH